MKIFFYFFLVLTRSFSYVVLNQIHSWCFWKELQSEQSCRISSNFYLTEVGVCGSIQVLIITMIPSSCSFNYGTLHFFSYRTEVQLLLLCSFNLPCPGWLRIYSRKLILMLVLDHIDANMMGSILEFVSLSVCRSHSKSAILHRSRREMKRSNVKTGRNKHVR